MERSGPLSYGDLVVDSDAWEVRLRGDIVDLTKTEFGILVALASRPRSVVTDEELTRHIWGDSWFGDEGNLAVHISKLRAKLGESGSHPRYVRTVRGVGYRFDPDHVTSVRSDGFSEEYVRLVRDPDGAEITTDADLVILAVTTQRTLCFGWPTDGLVGQPIPFLAGPRRRSPLTDRSDLEELLSRGVSSWSGSRPFVRVDGSTASAVYATYLQTTPDGGLAGVRFAFVESDGDDSGTGHG